MIIDEINKQAALSGKKIDDAATNVGAFGGDREAVAKSLLEEARLYAISIMKDDPGLKSDKGKNLKDLLYLFERDVAIKTIRAG